MTKPRSVAATANDNSIPGSRLENGAVTGSKLADGAVTQSKIANDVAIPPANNSITDAQINTSAGISAAKLNFLRASNGAVPRTVQSRLSDGEVFPADFGAVGDGETDDTLALWKAFSTGKKVNGDGKLYKVVPTLDIDPGAIIDTSATAGVGYGPGKLWFRIGPCRNIRFKGDISFGGNYMGKWLSLDQIYIEGDARFSSWYTNYQGIVVTGKSYFNSDYPPNANFWGFYYNEFHSCIFSQAIVDQRYGPCNLNLWSECQFGTFEVKDTGTAGWSGAFPAKDFHLNSFIGCEWFTNTGVTAPDGRNYAFVIFPSANVGGINKLISCYMEMAVRGFYGPGFEVENLHLSGENVQIGGGQLGYNSPLTGEAGTIQRDVPHIYPAGNFAVGGDWSILDSAGKPYCLTTSGGVTTTFGTDPQEPTGLGKYVQLQAASGFNTVVLNSGAANTNNRTLRSYAMIYKVISGDPVWEAQAPDGSIVYGSANLIHLDNGWVMAAGHTYGFARLLAGGAYTVQVSAISMGRGAGLVSPVTNQPGNKPLIDLSGGPSLYRDAFNSSGLGTYTNQRQKTMSNSSGNVDFYRIELGNFSGLSCHVRVNFSLLSTTGGSRAWFRESLITENGAGGLGESVINTVNGTNGSLSFVLSGSNITIRTTSSIASSETGRVSIQLLGYDMGASKVVLL